jgi:uncharacterized membrane protein (DUF485 family)
LFSTVKDNQCFAADIYITIYFVIFYGAVNLYDYKTLYMGAPVKQAVTSAHVMERP